MKLAELAFSAYMYPPMTGYNSTYQEFTEATDRALDLTLGDHRIHLLTWLNLWGCRQFSKDCHDNASEQIREWYEAYHCVLPPRNRDVLHLSGSDLRHTSDAYADLKERTASSRRRDRRTIRVRVGPTGAGKVLFALRPHAYVPWDAAIRDEFGLSGSAVSYLDHLESARQELVELGESCKKAGIELCNVPELLGRPRSSLAKLVDEYYWVTISQKCSPPRRQQIAQWAAWYQE